MKVEAHRALLNAELESEVALKASAGGEHEVAVARLIQSLKELIRAFRVELGVEH